MATRLRPLIMTGTALASAAAIVVAAPTITPTSDITIAGAPTPAKLSTAKVELTALADITVQGISDAYWFGWGGYIGSEEGSGVPDPYYPEFEGDLFSSGASGVLYYLTDNILDEFAPIDIDNYYFEIGTLAGGPNAGYSPWGAVIYVGTNQIFGQGSPIGLATEAIFRNGLTNTVNGLIVALTDPIPVIGTATSIYYTGFSNDLLDPTFYGTGVPGLLAYASTVITGLLPGGVLPFAATKTAATPLAATATKAIEAVTEKATDGVAGAKLAAVEEKTSNQSESKSESTDAETVSTETEPETKTETEPETETGTKTEAETETGTKTETGNETSTDAKADTPAADAPAVKVTTGRSAAPKTGKKADNPLAKIGKRIADAVSGKKAKGGESNSSGAGGSDAGSAGSGDSSGSAG